VHKEQSAAFVYVRLPDYSEYAYLAVCTPNVNNSAIPVQIPKGVKDLIVDVSAAVTSVVLFFNVS
jgi:hypothetical protein